MNKPWLKGLPRAEQTFLPLLPRTHNIPALTTCWKAKKPVQHGWGTCDKSHLGGPAPLWLPSHHVPQSHGQLLQEVSLPAALGVTDVKGDVGRLCDSGVGAALIESDALEHRWVWPGETVHTVVQAAHGLTLLYPLVGSLPFLHRPRPQRLKEIGGHPGDSDTDHSGTRHTPESLYPCRDLHE